MRTKQKWTAANIMRITADDLEGMTSCEASRLPCLPNIGDGAVTIHIGGREENWISRFFCEKFYALAAAACEGSEAERYRNIAFGCAYGDAVPSDGVRLRCERGAA